MFCMHVVSHSQTNTMCHFVYSNCDVSMFCVMNAWSVIG